MTKIEELEYEIQQLPKQEYKIFRSWFLEKDWQEWDDEIEQDSASGKLDFLIDEAMDGKNRSQLRDI